MRSTLTFQRLSCLFLLSLTLAGCKQHQSADTPTILGTPATTAYLGVDYYYDFGAYGGDNLLNYSLSNAPAWMALENTTNKARPGIILHGVPGITGGRRGAADLGTNNNIGIYANDGSLLGGSTFNVDVKWNALAMDSSTTVTEGQAYTPKAPSNTSTACDMPKTDVTGTLTDTGITTYDASGNAIGVTSETFKTYPIVIPVTLTQPSVEPIAVAFEISSKFNPSSCDVGSTPAAAGDPQPRGCEFSKTNRNFAQLKRDVIATTNTLADTPSYLSYNADQVSGLLTIPAGKSTCYIRLEVTDDNFAEEAETFSLSLTEVRSGLASLKENGAQATNTITIEDNEPTVTFSKTSDYVSKGDAGEYTAHLSAAQSVDTSFYLGSDTTKTTLANTYYTFEDDSGNPLPNNLLVFPKGQTDVKFKVGIDSSLTSAGSFVDDRLLSVIPDMYAGYGRSNFAGAGTDAFINVYVNEWLNRLQVGTTGGFVPESMAIGDSGHAYIAGSTGGKVGLKMYDRTGTDQTATELDPLDPTILTFPGNQTHVRVAYGAHGVTVGSTTETRRELAIGFSTDTSIDSSAFTQAGGTDVAVAMLKRQASATKYTKEWAYQNGSSTDDSLTSIALDSNDNVYLGGQTTGTWGGVSSKGGNDIFVELLDNTDTAASTTWSTLIGSSSDDLLSALLPLGTSVYPVGTTSGYLATQDNNGPYGGVDGFFESLSSPANTPKVYQFGTDQNDIVTTAGFGTGQQLWVAGYGFANYVAAQNSQFKDPPDISSALNGFVAVYSTSRILQGVTTLSDSNAIAGVHLTAIATYGSQAVVGGYIDTGGSFQDGVTAHNQDLILVGLDNSTTGKITESWRLQQDDGVDEEIMALGIYNDRKLVALVRQGTDPNYTYQVRMYKLDGTELTKP